MKEQKQCSICKLGIDDSKEYARLTHFKSKKSILSESYYHINCFRERMSGSQQIKKLQDEANSLLRFAKDKLGIPEVVNI